MSSKRPRLKESNWSGLELAAVHDSANFPAPFVTFILKGTFDLVLGGVCKLSGKQRPIIADRRNMDTIGRSLAWSSDLVPFKPHSDFLVHGTFYQPGGVPAPEGRAGFAFGPLHKELAIRGPRTVRQHGHGAAVVTPPTPIAQVPLRWEYSAGGLRDKINPMGMGFDAQRTEDGDRIWHLPLIEDPNRLIRTIADRPRAANFAPVPPFFHDRRRRLGTRDHRWALFRAPLPPDDFDPAHYNAAPPDQLGGNYPRGDEFLSLRNMHPKHPLFDTQLPNLGTTLAVLRQRDDVVTAESVTMNLDTVVALPDEDQLVLVWRGRCPIAQARRPEELFWVAADSQRLGDPPPKPTLPERLYALYQAEKDGAAAKVAEKNEAADSEAAALSKHVADTVASVRSLLGKATLPPELAKTIATESDPAVLIKALEAFVDQNIAELARRYPQVMGPGT